MLISGRSVVSNFLATSHKARRTSGHRPESLTVLGLIDGQHTCIVKTLKERRSLDTECLFVRQLLMRILALIALFFIPVAFFENTCQADVVKEYLLDDSQIINQIIFIFDCSPISG